METRTADDVIEIMNEILAIDASAVNALLLKRVPCNGTLAEHETVQVRDEGEGKFSLSLLGILNGLFGNIGGDGEKKDWGTIMVISDWDDEKDEATGIQKFMRTEEGWTGK